jgi:hypothetical protein
MLQKREQAPPSVGAMRKKKKLTTECKIPIISQTVELCNKSAVFSMR